MMIISEIQIKGRKKTDPDRGGSRGGGDLGGHDTPPPFWGTPKLHKEGKKRRARVREYGAL